MSSEFERRPFASAPINELEESKQCLESRFESRRDGGDKRGTGVAMNLWRPINRRCRRHWMMLIVHRDGGGSDTAS